MNRDELLQSLTELGTIEDAAERRSKIVAISGEINSVFDSNESLTASNTKLEEDKQKLQNYNMELYLQIGGKSPKKGDDPDSKTEDLKYENLFDEKGELK